MYILNIHLHTQNVVRTKHNYSKDDCSRSSFPLLISHTMAETNMYLFQNDVRRVYWLMKMKLHVHVPAKCSSFTENKNTHSSSQGTYWEILGPVIRE